LAGFIEREYWVLNAFAILIFGRETTMMMDDLERKRVARVLFAYIMAFTYTIVLQIVQKNKAVNAFKEQKKKAMEERQDVNEMRFDRYRNPSLHAIDRAVANFVEWAPAFLTLFGAHVLVTGRSSYFAWLYVCARFLYPTLALNGGVTQSGAKPVIYFATVPGYIALLGLSLSVAFNSIF